MVQFREFPQEVQDAHNESKEARVNHLIDCLKEIFAGDKGTISVICGPMRSGKSSFVFKFEEEMRGNENLGPTFFFKPDLDTRDQNIFSREYQGKTIKATRISCARDIVEYLRNETSNLRGIVVVIEEMQFCDEEIIEVSEYLRGEGAHVILSGLDMDYRGEPFELRETRLDIRKKILGVIANALGVRELVKQRTVGDLMARASLVIKLSARTINGDHATHTELISAKDDNGNILIGDSEYAPVTAEDHDVLQHMIDRFKKKVNL